MHHYTPGRGTKGTNPCTVSVVAIGPRRSIFGSLTALEHFLHWAPDLAEDTASQLGGTLCDILWGDRPGNLMDQPGYAEAEERSVQIARVALRELKIQIERGDLEPFNNGWFAAA